MSETNISGTVDGLYYGFVVSLAIFGITVSQSWTYLHNNTDKWPLRLTVLALVSFDFAEICCASVIIHHYLIENFGDAKALRGSVGAVHADFLLTGLIFFIVHIFFARRLFLLSKSWWISGFIVSISTAMLGINIHVALAPAYLHEQVQFRSKALKVELPTFHALAAATDVVVTIGFVWFLSKLKTEFKSTRKILQRLFVYSITRGLLITAVQIAHLVMFFIKPGNMLFWISLHLVLSKLYVTTMLVMLNSRATMRESMQGRVITESLRFTDMDTSNQPNDTPNSLPPASTKMIIPKLNSEHEIDIEAEPRSAISMTFAVHRPIVEDDGRVKKRATV